LGTDVAVKYVKIFNRIGIEINLSNARVSLIDKDGKTLDTYRIGNADGIAEFNIPFGPRPTGEPMLSDSLKQQIGAQINNNIDLFDSSIALVFGNKTTIGQVCSFAKGLQLNKVTKIPGFCCLDAPYQSKIEEWGEKVSLWDDARMEENQYCNNCNVFLQN
jgi:hypothetical protein